MICKKCGHNSEGEPQKDPWCMYKVDGDRVISQLFDPDHIPKGWFDSPGAARASLIKKRPKKATNEGLMI